MHRDVLCVVQWIDVIGNSCAQSTEFCYFSFFLLDTLEACSIEAFSFYQSREKFGVDAPLESFAARNDSWGNVCFHGGMETQIVLC